MNQPVQAPLRTRGVDTASPTNNPTRTGANPMANKQVRFVFRAETAGRGFAAGSDGPAACCADVATPAPAGFEGSELHRHLSRTGVRHD
jgi:hypothetical protein